MRISKLLRLSALSVFALALALNFAGAGEGKATTLEGEIVCAKCSLKEKDRSQCQNVLQVKNEKGGAINYYMTKNDVSTKYGEVCTSVRTVKVTGLVSEKDGQKWIAAEKIEDLKKS